MLFRANRLGHGSRAYLWIQNRDNTWWRNCLGRKPRIIKEATVTLTGMQRGPYAVEWWDAYKGRCVKRGITIAAAGWLVMKIEALEKDLACKVKKVAPGMQ